MIVEVALTFDSEYIDCHSKVGRNIRQLQREFDKWIYDRKNEHPYWVVVPDGEGGEIYRGK